MSTHTLETPLHPDTREQSKSMSMPSGDTQKTMPILMAGASGVIGSSSDESVSKKHFR